MAKKTIQSTDLIVMAVKTRANGIDANVARDAMVYALNFLRKTFGMKCELTTQFDLVNGNLKEVYVFK